MKKIVQTIFLICFLFSFGANAMLTASTKKKNFGLGEAVVLEIKSDENLNEKPDLSVLKNIFSVLSTSVSRQSYIINGAQSFEMNWEIVLNPLQKGQITIPPIVVGHQKTNPLQIVVSDEISDDSYSQGQQTAAPLFSMETEIQNAQRKPFVQEQINYIVRIKDDGILQNATLDFEPTTDFIIKEIGKIDEKRTTDGHRVLTYLFALFAQRSGKLSVPTVHLNGYVMQKPNVNNIFQNGFFGIHLSSFFDLQAPVSLEQKGPEISVLPVPKDYTGQWFLPAKNVEIKARFVDLPQRISEGSSIVREITLRAVGLTGSQLPEFDIVSSQDLKQYPEKPVGETTVSDHHVIGTLKTVNIYVPQKTGDVILPEIKVPWYDVQTGQIKTAVLEAQKVFVYPNGNKNINEKEEIILNDAEKPEKTGKATRNTEEMKLYVFVLGAFLAGVLLTYLLIKPKKEKKKKEEVLKVQDVLKSADKKDLRALRDNIVAWTAKEYPLSQISNLNDVANVFENEPLKEQLDILSCALYGQESEKFNVKIFQKVFKSAIKEKKKNKVKNKLPIPPLYQ